MEANPVIKSLNPETENHEFLVLQTKFATFLTAATQFRLALLISPYRRLNMYSFTTINLYKLKTPILC